MLFFFASYTFWFIQIQFAKLFCNIVASDTTLTEAKSIIGYSDLTMLKIIEALLKTEKQIKNFLLSTETEFGQTPLHFAFKNSNLELVMCIIGTIK